jgi:hypothetical protein
MVDLSQAPFHLDAEALAWVEQTLSSMTLDEKLGQLFINLNTSFDEGYLDTVVGEHAVGGIRFMGAPPPPCSSTSGTRSRSRRSRCWSPPTPRWAARAASTTARW